jgi:hypothetical protein
MYKPENKRECDVEIKCEKPNQQNKSINTDTKDYFEDFHIVKTKLCVL